MDNDSLRIIPVSNDPFNAESPLQALRGELTSTELFYVRNHFDVPQVGAGDFHLEINGAVAWDLSFSLDQLANFPKKDYRCFGMCR